MKSFIFLEAKPGSKGRRLSRNLDDSAVARAKQKSMDSDHQFKFLSRSQKFGAGLRKLLEARAA